MPVEQDEELKSAATGYRKKLKQLLQSEPIPHRLYDMTQSLNYSEVDSLTILAVHMIERAKSLQKSLDEATAVPPRKVQPKPVRKKVSLEQLEECGGRLMDTALEYRDMANAFGIQGAVIWLTGVNGQMVIVTREEERETLMRNILSRGEAVSFGHSVDEDKA